MICKKFDICKARCKVPQFKIVFNYQFYFIAGSAKKRDVRTVTISPNDLGPPSKSSENAKTINIKPITLRKYILLLPIILMHKHIVS